MATAARVVSWLVVASLLGSSAAYAQTPDPARLAAARAVPESSGTIAVMLAGIRANIPAQRQANPQVPAEFWTRFEERVIKAAPELVDSVAVLYAREFTLQELRAFALFYKSPMGQRLVTALPGIVTESAAVGQRWGARIGQEVGRSLDP